MTRYEIMYIIKPTFEEAKVTEVHESFVKVLTDLGANITKNEALGQKQFAYEIKKFKSGFYFLINLEANDSKAIDEFDRLARINENIVRHLIINLDK